MAKVSLIMPVYNTERFIERSLRSALGQTFADMEFVIVNDCTPDNAMAVVERVLAEYPDRREQVRIVSHPSNRGYGVAIQTGFDNATGEYTIHLDSDDYCDATMVEELYDRAKRDEADIVICDHYETFSDREIYRKQPAPHSGKECAAMILNGIQCATLWNKLIRRELYTAHGIAATPEVDMGGDLSLTVRLCYKAERVSYLNKAFVHYVQYNSGAYTKAVSEKSIQSLQNLIAALTGFYQENDPDGVYEKYLQYRKIEVKYIFFKHAIGKRRRELLKMYPESNRYIFSRPDIRIHSKYAFWFASHNMFFIADMIYNGAGRLKRIIRPR